MAKNSNWKDAARKAGSINELRDVLEAQYPAFKEAADSRRMAEAMAEHLRAALKRTRKNARISQTTLAEIMGTTQSSISALETGPGDLGVVTLFRYLEGLRINPADWLNKHAHEIGDVDERYIAGS